MAHVREEFALGAVRGFGRFGGAFQGFLFRAAFGDVEEGKDGAGELAVPQHGMGPVFHQECSSIGAPEVFVFTVAFLAAVQRGCNGAISFRIRLSVGMRMVR